MNDKEKFGIEIKWRTKWMIGNKMNEIQNERWWWGHSGVLKISIFIKKKTIVFWTGMC